MPLLSVNWNPDRKQCRRFGWACLVACGALGAWAFVRHSVFGIGLSPDGGRVAGLALWGAAGACGVLSAAAPGALRWLYVGLTLITFPIGLVVSHVVVGVIFYLVFTPLALFFRLVGRDALEREFDPSLTTYWVPRKAPADVRRYFRQS